MFVYVPARRRNPFRWATPLLVIACVAVFCWLALAAPQARYAVLANWGTVPAHLFDPFAGEQSHRAPAEPVGRGGLAPHQQAEAICPVQEARVLGLLVQPHRVEAHRFGEFDLRAKEKAA